jgi:surfeit locus 1 family protein
MARYRFRPKVVPTLAALAGCAVLVSLGFWQLSRHHEKAALLAEAQARLALPPVPLAEALARPSAHAWRRVTAAGAYLHDDTVLVLNRHDFTEGSIVLTPLLVAGLKDPEGQPAAILVDRGWVASDQEEAILTQRGREEPVEVVGSFVRVPARETASAKTPPEAPKRRRWLSLNLPAIRAQASVPVLEALVKRGDVADGDLPEGEWAVPRPRVNHLEYAGTWFLIAATLAGIYLAASLRRSG